MDQPLSNRPTDDHIGDAHTDAGLASSTPYAVDGVRQIRDTQRATSSIPAKLRHARRRDRGWSQSRLAYEIIQVGRRHHKSSHRSLLIMLSGWENGRCTPDQHNRRLLCLALGKHPTDLGMDLDPDHNWFPSGDL